MAYRKMMAFAVFLALTSAPHSLAQGTVPHWVESAVENNCQIAVTMLEKKYASPADQRVADRRSWLTEKQIAEKGASEAARLVNAAMKRVSPKTRKLYGEYENLIFRNLTAHSDALATRADGLKKELLHSFYHDIGNLEGYQSLRDMPYCYPGSHLDRSKMCIDDRGIFNLYGLVKRKPTRPIEVSLGGFSIDLNSQDTNPDLLTISIYSLTPGEMEYRIQLYGVPNAGMYWIDAPPLNPESSYTASLTQLLSGKPIQLSQTHLSDSGQAPDSRAEYVLDNLGSQKSVCADSKALRKVDEEAVEDRAIEQEKIDHSVEPQDLQSGKRMSAYEVR